MRKNNTVTKMTDKEDLSVLAEEIVSALSFPIIVFNNDMEISFSSASALALWGAQKNLLNIFSPTHPVIDAIEKCRKTGHAVTLYDISTGKGKASTILCTPMKEKFLLCLVPKPEMIGEDSFGHVQASLRPTQMMARMLAHEIKNPLAGIQAAAQILLKSETAPDSRELLSLITEETARISRLVDKADIFGGAVSSCHRLLNLHEIMPQINAYIRASFPEITVVEQYDPSLPEIEADKDLLTQSILNIVLNAAEALAKKITLRTRFDMAAPFHPQHHKKLSLVLEIENDGEAINPEVAGRMFEPCYTTKPQGKGLGLAIVAKIISDHGAIAEVASRNGNTVMRLRFPVPTGQA